MPFNRGDVVLVLFPDSNHRGDDLQQPIPRGIPQKSRAAGIGVSRYN
jgi:hypothetical protein